MARIIIYNVSHMYYDIRLGIYQTNKDPENSTMAE